MSHINPSFFHSLRFRYGAGLVVFLIIGGYFLWQEHEAHILGYLPLILLFGVCIGMHFFMHGGHGHGKADDADPTKKNGKDFDK